MTTKTKKKREKKKPQKKPKAVNVSDLMANKHVQRAMMSACEDTVREVRIANASSFNKLQCINFERIDYHLYKHLPSTTNGLDKISQLAKQGLTLELNEGIRDWQYWVGLFTNDGFRVDIEAVVGRVQQTNSKELTELMPQLVDEAFDSALYLDREVDAWAWIIAPTFDVDFDLSSESFIRAFIENHNLLNEDLKDGEFTGRIG